MLFVSILTSDREKDPELWAVIWQGQAPPTLKLRQAYNLAGNKRVYVWEGESVVDLQFMDRFNEVGVMETCPAFDRTLGWQQAFAGDLEGFRSGLEQRGISQRAVEAALDLRERGHRAPNLHAAKREAREWVSRQSGGERAQQP